MIRKKQIAVIVLFAGIAMLVANWRISAGLSEGTLPPGALPVTGTPRDDAKESASKLIWPAQINRPQGPPRIATGAVDHLGRPVTVSCASCHASLEPNLQRRAGSELTQFHTGLKFAHGELSCVSCHNPSDYNTLRLADSSPITYPDVHLMCAQCHASQARDFAHGAHGGATGYWDRTRGPQVRKNCIDCHDPHAPAFPSMLPTFKPRDRFLDPSHSRSAGHD